MQLWSEVTVRPVWLGTRRRSPVRGLARAAAEAHDAVVLRPGSLPENCPVEAHTYAVSARPQLVGIGGLSAACEATGVFLTDLSTAVRL